MSENKPVDPKEAMRQALERKKQAHHDNQQGPSGEQKLTGGPHGPAAAKRVFRRKSGG